MQVGERRGLDAGKGRGVSFQVLLLFNTAVMGVADTSSRRARRGVAPVKGGLSPRAGSQSQAAFTAVAQASSLSLGICLCVCLLSACLLSAFCLMVCVFFQPFVSVSGCVSVCVFLSLSLHLDLPLPFSLFLSPRVSLSESLPPSLSLVFSLSC